MNDAETQQQHQEPYSLYCQPPSIILLLISEQNPLGGRGGENMRPQGGGAGEGRHNQLAARETAANIIVTLG